MRVDELAEQLAIHPNTVRFHLGVLQADGTACRSEQHHGGRGRPSAVYVAAPESDRPGRRDPVLLSRILLDAAESPAGDSGSAGTWEAGRRWGRARAAGADPGAVRRAISQHLADTGFEPGVERGAGDGDDRTRIPLLNCAFADLADTHQDSVCALHAGMLEGVRQAVDPDEAWEVELRPFVTPSVCEVVVCCRSAAADGP